MELDGTSKILRFTANANATTAYTTAASTTASEWRCASTARGPGGWGL